MLGRPLALIRLALNWYPVRFLREVIRRFGEDKGGVIAGYIAYTVMLSSMPFMIFTVTFIGTVIGPDDSAAAIAYVMETVQLSLEIAPEQVATTLEPVMQEIASVHASKGILTVSALGTLYAASNGVEAIRIGLDRAYDIDNSRGFVINRLISVGVVILAFLVFGTLMLIIVLAPLVLAVAQALTPIEIPTGVDAVRYLAGAVLLYGFLWLIHHILPDRPMWRKTIWPGILVSMLLWGLMASAASFYVANSPNYSLTYGALTGVIVTLLFFYLTGVAIILGGEVNAVVNFGVPEPTENDPDPNAPKSPAADQMRDRLTEAQDDRR